MRNTQSFSFRYFNCDIEYHDAEINQELLRSNFKIANWAHT